MQQITTTLFFFTSLITGMVCGLLLYFGKYKALTAGNIKVDRLFSVARYAIFVFFLFTILQLKTTISILFIALFLLSYLGTVLFCLTKIG